MTLLAALTRLRTNNLKGLSTTLTFYRPRDRMRIRKLTLGSASAINATEARRQAREILGQIAAGKDPADERLACRDGSLRIAYDAFKAEHLPFEERPWRVQTLSGAGTCTPVRPAIIRSWQLSYRHHGASACAVATRMKDLSLGVRSLKLTNYL